MNAALIQSWFVEMVLATGLLMVIVLIVRKPVARHFGPRVAYALWLLPAMRAVLPPMPDAFVSVQGEVMQVLSSPFGQSRVANISVALLIIWLLGAAAFFIWHSAAYARFSVHLRSNAAPMFDDGTIKVARSPDVLAPLAFGLVEKAVIVPHDFAHRYDGREQHFAIGHELSHHRRGDLLANGFALIFLSLHWFNPIAHFAFRAFRADQEAACDATVLRHASDEDRHAYGRALVKSALGHAPLVACRISGAGGVKTRLTHIIAARDTAHMHESGLFLAGILIFTGLGITASGGVDEPRTARPKDSALAVRTGQATAPLIRVRRFADQGIVVPQLAQPVSSEQQVLQDVAADTAELIPASKTDRAQDDSPPTPLLGGFASPVKQPLDQQLAAIDAAPGAAPILPAALVPQPKAAAVLAQNKCDASNAVMISEAVFMRGGNAQRIAVVLCATPELGAPGLGAENQRAALITSLHDARRKIAGDDRLPIEARAHMIDMLEIEIRRIEQVAA
jgi:bla regulator protein blaR1